MALKNPTNQPCMHCPQNSKKPLARPVEYRKASVHLGPNICKTTTTNQPKRTIAGTTTKAHLAPEVCAVDTSVLYNECLQGCLYVCVCQQHL